mmetsp:Transcript_25328/g.57180  ORF Transcript_25328/g.57180 Transcript_25328/m.57180 type:complete len:197 (+) Transcript_25328:48-638(+)
MTFFGQPPDPTAVKSFFPGISARSFSPVGASVCYRECIMKENMARSDAQESEKLRQSQSSPFLSRERSVGEILPGQGSINSAYTTRGWKTNSFTGRWLPPDFRPETAPGPAPAAEPPRSAASERPRSRGTALPEMDPWRTTSWSDFGPKQGDFNGTVASNAHASDLVRIRCGARSRKQTVVKSVDDLDFVPRAPWC